MEWNCGLTHIPPIISHRHFHNPIIGTLLQPGCCQFRALPLRICACFRMAMATRSGSGGSVSMVERYLLCWDVIEKEFHRDRETWYDLNHANESEKNKSSKQPFSIDNLQYNALMTYLNFLLGAFSVILITYVSKVRFCLIQSKLNTKI